MLIFLFCIIHIVALFSIVLLLSGIQKAHREAQVENIKRIDQMLYIMSKYDRMDNKQTQAEL